MCSVWCLAPAGYGCADHPQQQQDPPDGGIQDGSLKAAALSKWATHIQGYPPTLSHIHPGKKKPSGPETLKQFSERLRRCDALRKAALHRSLNKRLKVAVVAAWWSYQVAINMGSWWFMFTSCRITMLNSTDLHSTALWGCLTIEYTPSFFWPLYATIMEKMMINHDKHW